MKKIYKKLVAISSVIVFLFSLNAVAQSPTTFTTTGSNTFIVPCGVTTMSVQVWGAGGGGGGGRNTGTPGGSGGGGGGYTTAVITVSAGQVITYFVGAGGGGGGAIGADGGDSFFASVIANGGKGGLDNGGAAGAGGTGSGGVTTNGANGVVGTGTNGGAGGAGANGGAGGATATIGNNGNNGNIIGGGGSGAGQRSGASETGGDGARGQIIITWVATIPCVSTTTTETLTTCGSYWTDNGGIAGNYTNSLSYTKTFCPSSPGQSVKLNFSSFQTQGGAGVCNDYLELWQGSSATGGAIDQFCGALTSFTVVSTDPSGCVTIRFTSDGATVQSGWVAQVSCVTPCTNPLSSLATSAAVNLCSQSANIPGSLAVAFNGSSSTSAGGTSISAYEWEWGDGTVTTTTSPLTTHTYPSTPAAAIYVAKLFVRDNNFGIDPLGCRSTNSTTRVVSLLPVLTFTGTNSLSPLPTAVVTVSCSQSTTLTSDVRSQTVTESPTPVTPPNVALPDGSGVSYSSGIDFSGFFPVGSTMSAGCFPTLTFNIEHSFSRDLTIDLISPDGVIARVFNRHISGDNGGLTSAKFGTCVKTADDGIPGCGTNYTVVNSGGVAWTATGVTTAVTSTCATYTGACEAGNYFLAQTYNSTTPFSTFTGTALNGVWSIKVTDNQAADDGTLFNWSLTFPPACYKPLETKTPDVTSLIWSHAGGGPIVPVVQPTTITAVLDPGPDICQTPGSCVGNRVRNNIVVGPFTSIGTYTYSARATDEFGCTYDRSVNVVVSKPTVTVPASFTICENLVVPATTFTTTPLSTAATYAWSNSNINIGLAASGTGNITSFTATNPSSVTIFATIVVTPTLGCVGTPSTYTIAVDPAPTIVVTATSNTVCAGLPTTLTAIGASSYTWSPATYLSGTSGSSVVSNPTSTITYSVTGITTSSCNALGTRIITVNPVATVTIGGSATICNNTSTIINFTGTPSAITTYTINGGANQTITLSAGGIATLSTGNLTLPTTYSLVGASLGSCSQVQSGNAIININTGATPITSFIYSSPTCSNGGTASPSLAASFTTGGTFVAPAGCSINASTGDINLSSSTSGTTYVVTYTYPSSGCSPAGSGTTSITITTLPAATITYAGNPFCTNNAVAQAVTRTGTTGGTYSAGSGLTIDGSTGAITASTSTAGSYIVSYTIAAANGCSSVTTTTPVTVTALPAASISYSGTPFCSTVSGAQSVTLTGSMGGTFAANNVGLNINSSTGNVDPSLSTANSYVVSYTIAANAGCPAVTSTTSLTVTALPTAVFSYSGTPYCTSVASAQAVGFLGTTGGSYTFSPSGLSINGTTGAVTPSLSSGGLYTVSYTVSANGGCAAVVATNNVVITTLPTATITYASNPYCNNVSATQSITQLGSAGGTYSSSPAGLSITPSNGNVVPNTSTTTSYVVSYTVASANGCSAVTATTPLTITPLPAATITYGSSPYCKSIASNQNVTRSGTAGGTYSVSPAGLTINASTGAITPSTSTAGTYVVSYTFAAVGGCGEVIATAPLTISPVPTVDASSAQTLTCAITSISLNGTSDVTGSSFNWTGPGITSASTISTITVNQIGTYTMNITTPAGCTNSDFVVVTNNITPPAGVDAGPALTLTCTQTTAVLTGTYTGSGFDTQWTGGSITSGSNTLNPIVNGGGIYTLTVTNTVNGCSATDVTTVTPDAGLPNISVGADKILTCLITTVTLEGATTTLNTTFSWIGTSIVGASNVLTITANAAGTYTLTVTNTVSGCSNVAQVQVIANNALPNVDAGLTDVLTCLVSTLTLNGSSTTGGVSFDWTGGNILSGSTTENPIINAPAVYTLTVTNPSNGCVNSDEVTITENITVPTADAGAPQSITCVTSIINLQGSSNTNGVNFNWDGVGFTSATNIATATVNSDGVFTLTVTDPNNGCFSTALTTVTINTITPDISVTPTATLTNCISPFAEISGSSITAGALLSWTGAGITSATDISTITINTDGVYTLTVTDPLNGCTAHATSIVSPNPGAPDINIAVTTFTYTCGITSLQINGFTTTPGATLSWTGPGVISDVSGTADVNVTGIYTLTVYANGCETTGTVNVIPDNNAPIAVINPTNPEIECDSTSVNLTVTPLGLNYVWTGPSILGSPTSSTIKAGGEGVYSVIVTDPGNGCSSAPASVTVTICVNNVSANAGTDQTVCSNVAKIELKGTTTSTTGIVDWSSNGGGTFANSSAISTSYLLSTSDENLSEIRFVLKITEGTESTTDTVVVKINKAPVADFTIDLDTVYVNQTVKFIDNSTDAAAWYWMFSNSATDTATTSTPKFVFASMGTFPVTLKVTAANTCNDTLVKNIDAIPAKIAVPEGFSPNGDGINDVLYVKGGPFKSLEFRIFNQWGNEVFLSQEQSIGWDGTYKSTIQPAGVFIYVVKATTFNDENVNFSGEVNLLN